MINNAWAGTMNMQAEINRLRADVGHLTKARDDEKERAESLERQLTTALVHHEAAYNDSIAAEKSRDEAVAELKKALEAIGQLRSDLAEAQSLELKMCEERDAAEEMVGQMYHVATGNQPLWSNFFGWQDALEEMSEAAARAQSAEASLAKLREAAIGLVRCVEEYDVGIGLPRLLGVGDRQSFETLRSLLDEPNKGGE